MRNQTIKVIVAGFVIGGGSMLFTASNLQSRASEQARGPAQSPPADNSAPLADPATIAASAGFVDLNGIKMGMTEQSALAAIKTDNPAFDDSHIVVLRLASQADIASGNRQSGAVLSITATAPVGGVSAAAPAAAPAPRGARPAAPAASEANIPTEFETVLLQFTAPPSQGFVWMGTRTLVFAPAQAPLVENVITGLRQKYGQESAARGQNLLWFFDGQRKLVPADQAAVLLQPSNVPADCSTGSERSVVIGGTLETAILAFSRNPARAPVADATGPCRDFTIVSANVGSMQPGTRMRSLIVTIENHPLIRSSNAAFAAYAQKTNQQQGTQQGVPKL